MAFDISTIKQSVKQHFSTPIVSFQLNNVDDMNKELKAFILLLESKGEGVKRSNIGGWHSTNDLFSMQNNATAQLKLLSEELILKSNLAIIGEQMPPTFIAKWQSWANVCRDRNYHINHVHPGYHWSGIYYIDVGKPTGDNELNGALEFIDPRLGVDMTRTPGTGISREWIRPESGLMILFPSWLMHMVHPYEGKGERMTIAFNALLEETTEPVKP